MVVTFNVVQNEHLLVPIRQLIDSLLQIQAVYQATEPEVRPTHLHKWLGGFLFGFGSFIQRYFSMFLPTESHEHDVHGQSVQPCGKAGFTPKSLDLAERLQEGFLHQVFSFGWVIHHAQAQTVYSPVVQLI
jgi:hypothetical protein